MAFYMTQPMSAPKTITITYYRKQSHHPSHIESRAFTVAAKSNYAYFNKVAENTVEEGHYRSSQGIPIGGKTYEI